MLKKNKVAVISTGNGGQTMAAYFANLGCEVTLYAREQERVDMFESNLFTLTGVINETVKISLISCRMEEVVKDAELIMVTTPSQYHSVVARDMAPYVQDGQIIVLNPGRTFGTYEFDMVLRQNGCNCHVLLAEAETFIFTCRCEQPGHPILYTIKSDVPVAAHRTSETQQVVACLKRYFPAAVVTSESVIHTGFSNMGMIFHPLPILMNLTRVEAKERFLYYKQGISPIVAQALERLDADRMAVANKLGVQVPSVNSWLEQRYGSQGNTLYERIQNTDAYSEVYAPTDLKTRYIFEDVCTGCVPIYCVGREIGVDTPIIKAVIDWATAIYDYDFYGKGRNDQKIDIKSLIEHIND